MRQSKALKSTLIHVIDRIRKSGKITYADEWYFMRAMMTETRLSHEEQAQVRDVIDRLQMGLLHVAD